MVDQELTDLYSQGLACFLQNVGFIVVYAPDTAIAVCVGDCVFDIMVDLDLGCWVLFGHPGLETDFTFHDCFFRHIPLCEPFEAIVGVLDSYGRRERKCDFEST